jgi:hypothetical protein
MNDRKRRLYAIIHDLRKQYPVSGVHTWSTCQTCRQNPARSGTCAECLTHELATLTEDMEAAQAYRETVQRQAELIRRMEGCGRVA